MKDDHHADDLAVHLPDGGRAVLNGNFKTVTGDKGRVIDEADNAILYLKPF